MEALFKAVVADLDAVRDAYLRAGLLTDGGPGSVARSLLGGPEAVERFRREVLLVDALVRHRIARLVFDRSGPRHIVVFGGNNVGKSTVVNILAADLIAGTSPEGGYTRHAHAFSMAPLPLLEWNPYAFNRFSAVAADHQPAGQDDYYTTRLIAAGSLPDNIVLWDSPDCDSVGSSRYLAAVVEVVALADLVIYVTSVEKYAVADLVEWLFQLHDAGIPILECLNKTPNRDRLPVMRKQREDVFPAASRQLDLPAPEPRIVALRYLADGDETDLWGADHPEAAALRQAALASLDASDEMNGARTALRSVQRRVERVLQPARMELSVRHTWKAAVNRAVAGFVTIYENEYLASGSTIEPFKKLNVELLELLNPDIPHLGPVIRSLRAVQRIPTELVKATWRRGVDLIAGNIKAGDVNQLAPELKAYTNAHRTLVNTLLECIDTERRVPHHHSFWDKLAVEWEAQAIRLADDFSQTTAAHAARGNEEIRTAARDILQALQQRPAVLGLLRAARVSTDIGGLLIGFLIPGHGSIVHDLVKDIVVAPAMLGATGFAASSAVEGYIAQRRSQIVEKLRAEVREMAIVLYAKPLDAVGDAVMTQVGAVRIASDLLDRIPANLRRLQEIAEQPTRARA
ncbi:GTPase domain-containing protein [Rhodopila sp.]|uniref:GTPase domain-containing protein n=1 Tax=Rhodopila sp. TaxID=2480087 RepID=UPI003D0B545E